MMHVDACRKGTFLVKIYEFNKGPPLLKYFFSKKFFFLDFVRNQFSYTENTLFLILKHFFGSKSMWPFFTQLGTLWGGWGESVWGSTDLLT